MHRTHLPRIGRGRAVLGTLVLTTTAFALSCAESRTGPVLPPEGSPPSVEFTNVFGSAPLAGEVGFHPYSGSTGWMYQIDYDSDGEFEVEGTVSGITRHAYRFDEPGIHQILVVLGPEGEDVTGTLVVVNGEGPVQILAYGSIPGTSIEGLTISPDGSRLFAADFWGAAVYEVLPDEPGAVVRVIPTQPSTEGLSVSPSGEWLFAVTKRSGVVRASVDAVPGVIWHRPPELRGELHPQYFIHALNDRQALISGEGPLARVDLEDPEAVLFARRPDGSVVHGDHFAVSPDRSRVIVVDDDLDDRLQVLTASDLTHLQEVAVPTGSR